MKKYLLWLLVISMLCSSAIIKIKKDVTQQTISRRFSLTIYKSIDYTSGAYNTTYAQLEITVEKVSNAYRSLVWNKTFTARLLRDYPAPDNVSTQILTIPNILGSEGHPEVTYTRIYNSDGYELQLKNRIVIGQNSDTKPDISI